MLRITRRDFLKYCSVAAGALGLSASTLMRIESVMAKTGGNGIATVWIAGAACTGCTMSLLNSAYYTTVDDVLLNTLDLKYLDTAMATAGAVVDGSEYTGANALDVAQAAYAAGGYVLVVEGAIPCGTPPGGAQGDYCRIGNLTGDGNETMLYNVRAFAKKAAAILAVGTCSSFGGVPGAVGAKIWTDARGLKYQGTSSAAGVLNNAFAGVDTLGVISTPVINIPGCPPHPDWIVGTIATLADTGLDLASVDASINYNRPSAYYRSYQCNAGPCPWRFNNTSQRKPGGTGDTNNTTLITEADYNVRYPQGNSKRLGTEKWASDALGCIGILGCKGRKTKADCSLRRWNVDPDTAINPTVGISGVNWCVGSRAGCHGCTEPTFPDKVGKFFTFA